MASGTAASRITGQIRTILLAAAIGTTGIAADAYQTGAMIPQVMFTLISGGIFNAVLVPQIVRTLKEEDAEDRLNKLITASVALLAALTFVLMLGTSVLTSIYLNSKWNSAQRALANAFTLWCMPQVFFYGLYTVLGQILAAKGRFTAYAWSSVGANVISCAGFLVFIAMFGNAQKQPMDFWSNSKVGLTAGAWTLGVAFQALILFIPLIRSGFVYRPRWGLKGIGLRSMGPVAAWSLGVVVIDQLANIVNARITNGAPLEGNPFDIAGNGSYQNAYTLYMLPYSLIAVSVSTAIFPQLSQAIAEGRIGDARSSLSRALRNVGLMMCFFSVVMLVIPVPIIRALLPSVNVHEAVLISGPLLGLTVGLAAVSAFLLIQRTFYAFEDGKQPFIFAAISNTIQVVIVLVAVRLAPPQYWTAFVGLSMALSNIISFPLLVHMLRGRFEGSLDGKRIAGVYGKALLAALISGAAALLLKTPVTRLVGAQISERHGHMSWVQAVIICIVITAVVTVIYCLVLYALHTEELTDFLGALARRLGLAERFGLPASRTGSILDEAGLAVKAQTQPAQIAQQAGRVVRSYTEPAGSDEMEGALEQIENAAIADAGSMNPRAFNQPLRIPPKYPPRPRVSRPTSLRPANQLESGSLPASFQSGFPTETDGAQSSTTSKAPVSQLETDSVSQNPAIMKPQLYDILLGRYQLTTMLKREPGLSAWEVNDQVLGRRSQLFIVRDADVIGTVNIAASALALSSHQQCTPVYQLHTRDGISLIVTALDAGSSLRSFIEDASIPAPSYKAIRTIIAQSAQALATLRKLGLTHLRISPSLIRLVPAGITLADAPVFPVIEPWQVGPGVDRSGSEEMVVRQLSGVLYALLTNSMPQFGTQPLTLDALPQDTPEEFRIICSRGLELESPQGRTPIPLVTLAELTALLSPWTPPEELTDADIAWPKPGGEASIQSALITPVSDRKLLPFPEAIRLSAQAANHQAEPRWGTNQLLFPERSEVELLKPSDTDTDLFSIFDERRIQKRQPHQAQPGRAQGISQPTQAVDVSAIRRPELRATAGEGQKLALPLAGSQSAEAQAGQDVKQTGQSDRTLLSKQSLPASALPPSFTPQRTSAGVGSESRYAVQASQYEDNERGECEDNDEDVADARLFGRFTTRSVVIAVAVALVAVGLLWATTTLINHRKPKVDTTEAWPQISASPFPENGSNENLSSKSDKHDSKVAQAVPSPYQPTNTTAYPVARQLFFSHPAGQDGMAWYVRLDAPHEVSKLEISIRQGSGHGQIFANATSAQPTLGQSVAEFAFDPSGTTVVTFKRPVTTQDLIVWVPSDGLPQEGTLHFNDVKVY
ncbi:lipid II flippase MurJ [Bombiscardovia apis]